jgi:hypothetical protein
MECGCVSVSLLLPSPVQSTAVSCDDSTVDTVLSTSGAHVGDDSVTVCGGSHKRKPLDFSQSSRSSKRVANLQPVAVDDTANVTASFRNGQQFEERIGELMLKQGVLERWLKVFVDESAVKRESIVLKFGRVRGVLESAERAALVAYDEEVRRVVKSCEVECESVEVLSQQLSACVLACGGGVTMSDSVDDSECVDKEGSVSVRSVNVALCEEGLCEVLGRCWSLVSVSSGDNDEEALRVAEAEVSICDQVSDVLLSLLVMIRLRGRVSLQLIPLFNCHRTSKQEIVQVFRRLLREKSMRNFHGVKVGYVFSSCGVGPLSDDLFTQALGDSSVLSHVSDDIFDGFIAKLTTEWLPDKRFELLYRGSRDGMTAAVFHEKCDGKGPTLVLVAGHSKGQPLCVFGGYAGKSWERGPEGGIEDIAARDSFVFTVLNPFGDGIVKMAVNEGSKYAGEVMGCRACWGPVFGDGFAVGSSSWSPTAVFDEEGSNCRLMSGRTFGDPLGRGNDTFTGAEYFNPLEIEVWSVC